MMSISKFDLSIFIYQGMHVINGLDKLIYIAILILNNI